MQLCLANMEAPLFVTKIQNRALIATQTVYINKISFIIIIPGVCTLCEGKMKPINGKCSCEDGEYFVYNE